MQHTRLIRRSRVNWTMLVDEALQKMVGLSHAQAAGRFGLSQATIGAWRERRAAGEPIRMVTRRTREMLRRIVDQNYTTGRIPIGITVHK